MQSVIAERRWCRFSLERPCVVARIALWIGRHDHVFDAVCVALVLLTLVWR